MPKQPPLGHIERAHLRDTLAAAALPGVMAYYLKQDAFFKVTHPGEAADWAYAIADAMLAQRDH